LSPTLFVDADNDQDMEQIVQQVHMVLNKRGIVMTTAGRFLKYGVFVLSYFRCSKLRRRYPELFEKMKMRDTNTLLNSRRFRVNAAILAGCLMVGPLLAVITDVAQAQDVTRAQAESGKYRAHQTWLNRIVPREAIGGKHDSLTEYAAKCDAATGIHVPGFSCGDGTEVPGQGDVPATFPPTTHCDQPNVLNGQCDPGSKFQVLPGGNADAVAVAHCRKVGLPKDGPLYNDIAVIQYNKKNGATCFYQALSNLPGQNIPAPSSVGENPWQSGNPAHWIDPAGTENIGCTGCHDNGGFIRSEYLAQLKPPENVLPNTASGFDNLSTPVKYVGLDYASNRSWSITAKAAPGDPGPACTTCHRLAVPNRLAFGIINGTAAHFANIATAPAQLSKNPHGPNSPIWMRPGQVTYNSAAEATATKFHNCAVAFFNSGFVTVPPGCTFTPLASPWSSGFLSNVNWTTGAYYGDRGTFFADVDGDKRADAVVVNNGRVVVRIAQP